MLELTFLTPEKIFFEGKCDSIVVPGEEGVLEILPFHKNFLSRLLPGWIVIDKRSRVPITRGVVKVDRNRVTIIAETA